MLTIQKRTPRFVRGTYASRWDALDPNLYIAYLEDADGNHAIACKQCNVSHNTVRKYRKVNPEFDEACDELEQKLVSTLVHKTFHKAIHGWNEPVYYKLNLIGYKRKFSPELMMFMLRSHRPERYNVPDVQNNITVEQTANDIMMYQRTMLSNSIVHDKST